MHSINENNIKLFGLYDALDIQRYRYYPETNSIFTFVGFSNPRQREEAKLGRGINKSMFEHLIYNYPYKQKKEELFTPDENLFYVYFKELMPSIKQIHLKNIDKFYGFENIEDMQKGYKIKKENKNYYTFFGFINAKLRSKAIETLKLKNDIDYSNIKIFYTQADMKYEKDDEEYDKEFSDDDYEEDKDSGNEEENKNSSENNFDEIVPNNENDSEEDLKDSDDDFDENNSDDGNEN